MRYFARVWLCLAVRMPLSTAGQGLDDAVAAGTASQHVERAGSPVQWKVAVFPRDSRSAGQEFFVAVQAVVSSGWHLYALDEPEDGPVPLEFSAQPGGPVALVSVSAERPQRGPAAGGAAPVNFYEGQPRFRLRLRAEPVPRTGTGTGEKSSRAEIEVRYQACNDRMCLPPRVATISFPVTGKP